MPKSTTYYLPMEGGLGAQLLTVILADHLQELGHRVVYDLSYFMQAPTDSTPAEGVSIWRFALDYYHIPLDSLPQPQRPAAVSFVKWLTRKHLSNRYLYDGLRPRFTLLRDALADLQRQKRAAADRLPVSGDTRRKLEALTGGVDRFAAIHLRRGDYFNVASHIVGEEEVVALLHQLDALPEVVFITSDGDVNKAFWEGTLPGVEIRVLTSDDLFLSHALMRTASLLVTSNSQFSYSAALLNERTGARICVPGNWLGFGDPRNQYLFSAGDWTIF